MKISLILKKILKDLSDYFNGWLVYPLSPQATITVFLYRFFYLNHYFVLPTLSDKKCLEPQKISIFRNIKSEINTGPLHVFWPIIRIGQFRHIQ